MFPGPYINAFNFGGIIEFWISSFDVFIYYFSVLLQCKFGIVIYFWEYELLAHLLVLIWDWLELLKYLVIKQFLNSGSFGGIEVQHFHGQVDELLTLASDVPEVVLGGLLPDCQVVDDALGNVTLQRIHTVFGRNSCELNDLLQLVQG